MSLAVSPAPGTILIGVTVPLHRGPDGRLMLENQACNGTRLWAENFERVIMAIPVAPGPPPPAWVPLEAVGPALERVEILELPQAWRPDLFFRALPATRLRLRDAIARADYVTFAIGGLFGDWGAVGAIEARWMGKAHAVWTDRVESEVTRRGAATAPTWRARLRMRLTHRPMAALERHVIRGATVGLFHGRETYETYAPHARAAELVHDVHITHADHIDAAALAAKRAGAAGGPLRLAYAGRADPMKGPFDWIEVLARLAARGVDFEASWLGDGPDLAEMRARAEAAGLGDRLRLPGFVSDRGAVLSALRAAQALLFCHKTPESPRVLIEALASGTPLVGYDSVFPRDLIAGRGGGVLTPLGDVGALAEAVAGLAADRGRLADLIGRAAEDGAEFEDVKVFAHRSEVIRRHLDPFVRREG